MSEPLQSTNVLPHTTMPKKLISANAQITDISSRPDQQQRNASKPIKASVKAASEQPSVAMLASLGIKVRDFAYESRLPPIQPIYRHPRQIQPAVVRTTLKRQYTEPGEDDVFSQSSSQPETSQKKLERTSTEPVIPPAPGPSAHILGFGFTNIDDYEFDSLQIDSQQSNIHPESSQMPPSNFESQESEPYVDTPPVTPKGSLQWPVPDTPASELDTESNSPLRFSQISDTSFSPKPNPSYLACVDDDLPFSTPPRRRRGKTAASLDKRPVDPNHDVHAPTTPLVLATRYHLRKRPAAPSSPFSRLHSLRPRGAVIPPTRSHCASVQSSHSRAKPKGESNSPSSRMLLRRAVTNRQEKRRRTS